MGGIQEILIYLLLLVAWAATIVFRKLASLLLSGNQWFTVFFDCYVGCFNDNWDLCLQGHCLIDISNTISAWPVLDSTRCCMFFFQVFSTLGQAKLIHSLSSPPRRMLLNTPAWNFIIGISDGNTLIEQSLCSKRAISCTMKIWKMTSRPRGFLKYPGR